MGKRLGPDDHELRRLLRKGLTHQEIADMYNVARHSIASAASRAGLTRSRIQYRVTELWQPIKAEHAAAGRLNMLRSLERKKRGEELSPKIERSLARFLEYLEQSGSVVAYVPDVESAEGAFQFIDRNTIPPEYLDDELPVVNVRLTVPVIAEIMKRKAVGAGS